VLVIAWFFRERLEIGFNIARQRLAKRTVNDRLQEFGNVARQRWAPFFQTAGQKYLPSRVVFVALKDERIFEVYAGDKSRLSFVRRYPILAASGHLGPKLREGDNQVPEGIYEIESLNPNSAYHVSMRLNYPNEFDRAQAAKDGRTELGGDIMIHGKFVSVGCSAVGDEAAEDLFTLAADAGVKNITVVCSPVDLRIRRNFAAPYLQSWMMELYQQIGARLPASPAP
jgi:murein L,D-transpeptidase YafK